MKETFQVGVISDTHSLLRPEAVDAIQGSDLIIHAGDIGTPNVLTELKAVAKVLAVRGNMDHGAWAQALPLTRKINAGSIAIYVIHDLHKLDLNPAAAGFSIVISGHTHRMKLEEHGGVIYLNPGSAGPLRFGRSASLARILIQGNRITPELIELSC